jgi:hypothetical protein
MGPALRGFGVRDFVISEHLMHKQKVKRNVELRNETRVWAQHFRVSGFTNSLCKNTTQRQTLNHEIRKRYGAQPISGFDVCKNKITQRNMNQ